MSLHLDPPSTTKRKKFITLTPWTLGLRRRRRCRFRQPVQCNEPPWLWATSFQLRRRFADHWNGRQKSVEATTTFSFRVCFKLAFVGNNATEGVTILGEMINHHLLIVFKIWLTFWWFHVTLMRHSSGWLLGSWTFLQLPSKYLWYQNEFSKCVVNACIVILY